MINSRVTQTLWFSLFSAAALLLYLETASVYVLVTSAWVGRHVWGLSGAWMAPPRPRPAPAHLHSSTWHSSFISIYPRDKEMGQRFQGEIRPCGGREGGEHFLARPAVKLGSLPWRRSWAWSFLSQGRVSHLTASDKLLALKRGILWSRGDCNSSLLYTRTVFPSPAEFTGRNSPFRWEQFHFIHLGWSTRTLVRSLYTSLGAR